MLLMPKFYISILALVPAPALAGLATELAVYKMMACYDSDADIYRGLTKLIEIEKFLMCTIVIC